MKVCARCRIEKPPESFYTVAGGALYFRCIPCCSETARERRAKDPEYLNRMARERDRRNYDLSKRRAKNLQRYNLTLERYQEMAEEQGGLCRICGRPERRVVRGTLANLAVDHDHNCCPAPAMSCGKCIRGLLCQECNQKLGTYETFKEKAEAYLASVLTRG